MQEQQYEFMEASRQLAGKEYTERNLQIKQRVYLWASVTTSAIIYVLHDHNILCDRTTLECHFINLCASSFLTAENALRIKETKEMQQRLRNKIQNITNGFLSLTQRHRLYEDGADVQKLQSLPDESAKQVPIETIRDIATAAANTLLQLVR